jgi:hypothetical protein
MRSFVVCGILASMDRSQDAKISCIKEGEITAEAADTVCEKTRELASDCEEDPFAVIYNNGEDEDEL